MLLVASIGEYVFPKSYLSSINLIHLAASLVFLQTVVLTFSIDFGRQGKLRIVFFFNLITFTSQILGYLFFDLISLSQVFFVQIFSLLIFLLIFFYKNLISNAFKFIQITLLFSFSIMMTTFYFDNSAQLLQVFLFLLGLFLSGITIQMWINLDSKSSS